MYNINLIVHTWIRNLRYCLDMHIHVLILKLKGTFLKILCSAFLKKALGLLLRLTNQRLNVKTLQSIFRSFVSKLKYFLRVELTPEIHSQAVSLAYLMHIS